MSSTAPQPALLFSFNGSNVESITGLSPFSSTLNTSTQFAPTYVTGLYGQAIYFNNSTYTGGTLNCYVNYQLTSLNLTSNNLSISLWINFALIPWATTVQDLFLMIDSTTTYYTLSVNSGVSALQFDALGTQRTTIGGPANLVTGQWVHTAIVFSNVGMTASNTAMTYYVNSIQQGVTSNVVRAGTSVMTTLYLASSGSNRPFWGSLQDLRIYNTALSAPQILGIYQSQGIPPRVALTRSPGILPTPVYLWPFQNSTIDVIQNKDTSSSNVNGAYNSSTNPNQFYPYYDTLTQRAWPSSLRLFNSNTAPAVSNTLTYSTLSGLPVDTTGNAVTVSFWFKWITAFTSGFSYILKILFTGAGVVALDTDGGFLFLNGGNISGTTFTAGRTTLQVSTPEKWYHVTLMFTAAQILVYGNGAFVGSGIGSFSNPLTVQGGTSNIITSITLGTTFISTNFSSVEFADLRIYKSALNSSQIQAIYTSGGISLPGGLVQPTYNWPFNGSTIDVIQGKDFATSNVSGTMNVNPYPFYDTTGQKAGNGSIAFYNPSGNASNALIYNVSFPIDQSNACTYSFWFKWIAVNSGSFFKLYSAGGGGMGGFQINSNNLQLGFNSIPGSSIPGVNPTFNISSPGVWYHVAVVATSSWQIVYGNGNLIGTSAYSLPLNIQSTANTIAAIHLSCPNGISNPTNSTSNEIADLRFYNQALNSQQIQGIYLSGGARPNMALTQTSRSGTSTTMNSG